MGNFIQHKRAVDSLNKTFSNYDKGNRHSGYLQEQGKRDIVADVSEDKEKLFRKLEKCEPKINANSEITIVTSDGGTIYFVSRLPEEKAKHTWYKKDEAYGKIDNEGKVEIYHVGGMAQDELDETQVERTQEIQTIVDREMEQLEQELQEYKDFKTEKSFSKKLIATITGRRPKMAKHKEMKKIIESLPDELKKSVLEKAIEQSTEKTFDESLKEQVIHETEVKYDVSDTKDGMIQDKDEIE